MRTSGPELELRSGAGESALQSAVDGMGRSILGLVIANLGYPPVAAAITQEVIDVAVIVEVLRAAGRPKTLVDY